MRLSDRMESRVSAATIPPMEWPTKTVRTEGSMVGEGVEAETSRSMTTFCSLTQEIRICDAPGPTASSPES